MCFASSKSSMRGAGVKVGVTGAGAGTGAGVLGGCGVLELGFGLSGAALGGALGFAFEGAPGVAFPGIT